MLEKKKNCQYLIKFYMVSIIVVLSLSNIFGADDDQYLRQGRHDEELEVHFVDIVNQQIKGRNIAMDFEEKCVDLTQNRNICYSYRCYIKNYLNHIFTSSSVRYASTAAIIISMPLICDASWCYNPDDDQLHPCPSPSPSPSDDCLKNPYSPICMYIIMWAGDALRNWMGV